MGSPGRAYSPGAHGPHLINTSLVSFPAKTGVLKQRPQTTLPILELCRSETQNLWLSVRATELDQSLQLGCCSDQTGQICETSWGGRRPGAGLSVHWRALAVQGGAATEPHPMAATPTVAMLQWDLVMADPAIFQQKVETSILILE